MAKKTPRVQETFHLANEESFKDYHDKLNGQLYDISASRSGESCTVLFYTEQTYIEMKELLQAQYQFQPNRNNCGIDTCFLLCDKKVVLNLYNNKKLLIQGTGSRLWRNSIFRELSAKLTPYIPEPKQETQHTGDDEDVVYSHTDTPLKSNFNNDSAFNKMVNKLRSPGTSRKLFSPSTPVANKQVRTNTPVQKTPITVDDEMTIVKTVQSPPTDKSENMDNNNPKVMNYKQQLEKQFKENKQLQDTFKDIMSQSKVLKNENDKLQKSIVALQAEKESLKTKLHTSSEKIKDYEKQMKTLKSNASKDSGNILVLEEENGKLKKKVDLINKEKGKLVDQLMKATTAKESVEDKIDTGVQEIKDTVMKEIHELRKQIESSRAVFSATAVNTAVTPLTETVSEPMPQPQRNSTRGSTDQTGDQSRSARPVNNTNRDMQAFIAGDSITQILSTKRMTDSNLKVNIKTHSGARMRTIENSVIKMADEDFSSVRKAKAIVLHVGTNNVTDADQPQAIAEEMRDLADTISNINSDAKIIVSSILPRKNDKLVNQAIMATNHSLKEVCEDKGYHFLDNNPGFIVNGIPDSSLYRDSIHLNPKGGKLLGTNIRQKLNSILNLSENNIESEAVPSDTQQSDFHRGRPQGGRQYRNRGMVYMPMPFLQPPWFMNQFQHQHNNNQMNHGYNRQGPRR